MKILFTAINTHDYTGRLKKEIYNGIPNVTVWRVLRKGSHLKAYKLSIVRQRWIVCRPLSGNVLVILSTQQHLEYHHCKIIFETACTTNQTHIEP
jgi:hypothetical protein